MKVRLDEKTIKYAMRQHKKGRKTVEIAAEIGVTQRHMQRLRAEYRKTGLPHVVRAAGRKPAPPPSDDIVRTILETSDKYPESVQLVARRLRRVCDISYHTIYTILKANGRVVACPAQAVSEPPWERIWACPFVPRWFRSFGTWPTACVRA